MLYNMISNDDDEDQHEPDGDDDTESDPPLTDEPTAEGILTVYLVGS